MTLEQEFESHIMQLLQITKDETGYKAPLFRRMVNERGALQTAKDLLIGSNKISEGLTQLVFHNRLNLSLEANVIKPEWRSLFTVEELKMAVKRLKDLNYLIGEPIEEIIQKQVTPEVNISILIEAVSAQTQTIINQSDTSPPDENKVDIALNLPPERKSYETNKIIRDQILPRQVKKMYEHKCQICETRLESGSYWYAEAAHIRALGEPHNGIDTLSNILCLCPNHHKLFDIGGLYIEDDLTVHPLKIKLYRPEDHQLDLDAIRYHRTWCIEK